MQIDSFWLPRCAPSRTQSIPRRQQNNVYVIHHRLQPLFYTKLRR